MKNYEKVQQRKISVTFFIVRGIHAILPYQMGDPMFAEVDHLLLIEMSRNGAPLKQNYKTFNVCRSRPPITTNKLVNKIKMKLIAVLGDQVHEGDPLGLIHLRLHLGCLPGG